MANARTITPDSNHTGIRQFKGFSIFEDSSAAATVRFYDTSASGQLLWVLNLAADQSASIFFPEPITINGGVYVDEATGSVTGSLLWS